MLIVLGGLPGVGKTTIARELARRIGAAHVRIDSIEYAIRQSGVVQGDLYDAGYRAAYAVAEDNLRLGLPVVADSVNPLPITRRAWREVAVRAGVGVVEIEVVCSDTAEHRRRVETRGTDFPGWLLTWQEVIDRDYHPWDSRRAVLDTAQTSVEAAVERAIAAIGRGAPASPDPER
jgi:predicted kinase